MEFAMLPMRRRARRHVTRATTWCAFGLVVVLTLTAVALHRHPIVEAVPGGSTLEVQITGRAGIPGDASAVAINLAAVDPAGPGFVTVYPCGESRPETSTLNHLDVPATSNSSIVKIGAGGKVCVYSLVATDVVVDVTGWFPAGADFMAITPNRLVDTRPAGPTSQPVAGASFAETFDGDTGLDRFQYGVYHRGVGYQFAGEPAVLVGDNNIRASGSWTADHDTSCNGPDTQRPLRSDFTQDTTGANDWRPIVDFHTDELVYTCKNHLMTSMGDVAAYSIVWFAPDQVFSSVSSVCFDVNLTDLGNRQWWKVGVVSDSLYNSTYQTDYQNRVEVPGFVVSDVGSANLDGSLAGPDRLIATWSGGASAGYPGNLKIGNNQVAGQFVAGSDKATRYPVCLRDNGNGTVTFDVNGRSATSSGSFPAGPKRVVFYDHNYTPDKDGTPIGHSWHWDNIIDPNPPPQQWRT
jgi:hypothetical protein